jgi:hypothetical protein
MATRDLITLDELEVHVTGLDQRKMAAERRLEALQNSSERIEKLWLMQRNPILWFVGQTKEQRRNYYNDLGTKGNHERGRGKGMRDFRFAQRASHLDVGDEEIEAAVEAAARITALERRR